MEPRPTAVGAARSRSREPSRARWVVAVMLAGTAMRLALAMSIGLGVDESYAAVMGRRLSLSYFDHPPMAFWWTGIATRLAASEDSIVVRAPFIVAFMLTTWLMYRLGALLFGESAGLWAAFLLNASLFFSVAAGGWALPDGPLLLFGAASAYCLARATIEGLPAGAGAATPGEGNAWWVGFGATAGLALLSKYHAVLLLVGAAVYLLCSRQRAAWLRRPGPYVALALATAIFLPVVTWNAVHDWASFRFQGGRAFPVEGAGGTPLLDSVSGQAVWILPWIWLPLWAVLAAASWKGPRDARRWLLVCLGAGPILVFTLVAALGSRGLPHWEAPGYFLLLPLLGEGVERAGKGSPRWVTRWLWGCGLGIVLVALVLAAHARTGWLRLVAPVLLSRGDPTDDLMGWGPVADQLRAWGFPKTGALIAAARWDDAAKLALAMGPATEVTCVGQDPRGFGFTRDPRSTVGKEIVLAVRRRPGPEPLVVYAPYFGVLRALGQVAIARGGREEITVSLYLGRGLRGPLPLLQRH